VNQPQAPNPLARQLSVEFLTHGEFSVVTKDGNAVARTFPPYGDEWARLFAAAPDLLRCCHAQQKLLLDTLGCFPLPDNPARDVMRDAAEVMARAEG
jgi:hypothetical protein